VLVPPVAMELEFKRPTLLPVQLNVLQRGEGAVDFDAAIASPGGRRSCLGRAPLCAHHRPPAAPARRLAAGC
jgi:hypothetical protein